MDIIPDPAHVALLTLPFLTALVGLYLILWRPLLDWLDERDETTASARREAQELDEAAEEQLVRIEERLAAARKDVGTLRQEARARAQAHEAKIVGEARTAAEARIGEAIAQIQADRDAAAAALKSSASELSADIAGRVLGRSVA